MDRLNGNNVGHVDDRRRSRRGLATEPDGGALMLSERVRTLTCLDWARRSCNEAHNIGDGLKAGPSGSGIQRGFCERFQLRSSNGRGHTKFEQRGWCNSGGKDCFGDLGCRDRHVDSGRATTCRFTPANMSV